MTRRRDLYVLVADDEQRRVLEMLLARRWRALGIRRVDAKIEKHPLHDAGVFEEAPAFLKLASQEFSRAIAVLDAEFGREPQATAAELKRRLEARIEPSPWEQPPLVVVIHPELEAWVWSDSPEVARILDMSHAQMQEAGSKHNLWEAGSAKPRRPKELLELIVRQTKERGPTPSEFIALAESVGLDRCSDPAFCELRDTLREWFGKA